MPDFFSPPDAQCLNTSIHRAYLYDGEGAAPAVLTMSPRPGHAVLVENPDGKAYVFRPIDKVVYGPNDPTRCDVLLHTLDRLQLIFAELKFWKKSQGWFEAGIPQLKRVIADFAKAHAQTCSAARYRKAYVCNPYHANFAYSHAGEIRDFRRATRFVLFPEGNITFS